MSDEAQRRKDAEAVFKRLADEGIEIVTDDGHRVIPAALSVTNQPEEKDAQT